MTLRPLGAAASTPVVSIPQPDAPADAPLPPFEPLASADQMEIIARRYPTRMTPPPPSQTGQTGQRPPAVHVPVEQRYAERRSIPDKIADVVTHVATLPFRLVGDTVSLIVQAVLALLEKLVPVPAVNAMFGSALGLIRGVARIPQSIVGVGATFLRNAINGRWAHSGAEALNMVFQPVAGALAVVAQTLLEGLQGADDALHPPRRLTEEEKQILSADYSRDVLDHTIVHDGDKSWVFAITGFAASAQTLDHHIYLRGGMTPPQAGATMRHELVHSLQYQNFGGVGSFLSDYFGQMAGLAITGKEYYADIRQEVEAYELQDERAA